VRPAAPSPSGGWILKGSGGVNSLTIVLLAGGAIASGFWLWQLQEPEEQSSTFQRLSSGYYLREAELVGTGADGEVLYRIQTQELKQNPDNGGTDLLGVALQYSPAAEVPWDLRADTGSMPPDSDILQLSGDVVAVTQETSGQPATIRTDYLEIDPQTFVAFTDRPVSIELPGGEVFATGMRVFLKEDRLQLIDDVTGTFTP
jgi:LPS export ABC transporter protein LptC